MSGFCFTRILQVVLVDVILLDVNLIDVILLDVIMLDVILLDVNPLGPRILLKHALLFPGFMAFLERFYFYVLKNL